MAHLMDPDEWDEDTAAMAEAMGFASFGGQNHPSKRRKYNARADDAFVAGGGDESTLPFHDAGSGSNNTPLGERRRQQQQPATKKQKTNANEIDLDDDDDDDQDQDGGNDENTDAAAAAGAAKEADDAAQDPEPQYIDTSQPPDQVQPGFDAIIGGPSGLPVKPTWGPYAGHGEGYTQPGPDRPRHGGGDKNSKEPWWNDYYDPAFNTNPWEQIEKAQGMEPRGTWLTYDESKAKWAAIQSQASSSSAIARAVAQTA